MATQARITGKVEYREGDGPSICIRPGPIEIEETELDVTLSWNDADATGDPTRGSAAIPIADFRRYVAKGVIEVGKSSAS